LPPTLAAPTAVVTPAVSLVAGPPQAGRHGAPVGANEQASTPRAASAHLAEPRAKDMRRALLGLRQDLMRMLAQINAARAAERSGH
jgi:hypothetical protein